MRLIDADELKLKIVEEGQQSKRYKVGDFWELNRDEIWRAIDDLPTIEERKTGKWIIKTVNTFELAYGSTGYEPVYECSVCGGVEESYLRLDEPIMPDDANFPNYCPNCGADMRGEGHE